MPAPADVRARRAVATIFFANGMIMASWVPHVPTVKQRLALSDGALGAVLLALAAGALASLSVAGWLVRRFGSRGMTSIAAIALCLALSLPIASPNVPAVVLALLLLGACNGMLDVSMNAQAVLVEQHHARPIMSSFHGLFSAGGLVGAGAAGLVMWLGAGPMQHVLGATLVALAMVGSAVPFLLPSPASRRDAAPSAPLFARPSGRLLGLGALAFAALLSEGAMADWSAVYLRDSLATSPAVAALAFAAFSLTMALGRFGGDRIVGAYGGRAVLRSAAALAAIGLSVALLLGSPVVAIIGCGLVGLGIANAIPILFSRAGSLGEVDAGTAIAAVATTGYCGLLAGPPLIGLLAELTTLPIALGLVAVACALMAVFASAVDGSLPRPIPISETRPEATLALPPDRSSVRSRRHEVLS